jgi:hypothetical protein
VPFNRNGDYKILRVRPGDHADKEGQKVICVQEGQRLLLVTGLEDRSEGTKLLRGPRLTSDSPQSKVRPRFRFGSEN